MNLYIIVEGEQTELSVYPAWLSILAPQMQRIDDATKVSSNNYYLFSAHGIPSIFTHVANAIIDVNAINASSDSKYDYIIVCLDTEEESRQYIEERIQEKIDAYGVKLNDAKLVVFEQKVCMETWFLGNRKVFKQNPQGAEFIRFVHHYNVKQDDPGYMDTIDEDRYNKAQFHVRYLKRMLAERNMLYDKNNTAAVCSKNYLQELINRYEESQHISTFGTWYEFVRENLMGKS